MGRIKFKDHIDIDYLRENLDDFETLNNVWDYFIGEKYNRKHRMDYLSIFLRKNNIMTKSMEKRRLYYDMNKDIELPIGEIMENCWYYSSYSHIYNKYKHKLKGLIKPDKFKAVMIERGYSIEEMRYRKINDVYDRNTFIHSCNRDIDKYSKLICPKPVRNIMSIIKNKIYEDVVNNMSSYINNRDLNEFETLSSLLKSINQNKKNKFGFLLISATNELNLKFKEFNADNIIKFVNENNPSKTSEFSAIISNEYKINNYDRQKISNVLSSNKIYLKKDYLETLKSGKVVKLSSESYRVHAKNKNEYMCSICGIIDHNNKPITLHVDHIDYNPTNNHPENLRLLCPNCHSQVDNKKTHKKPQKPTKEVFEMEINSMSLREVQIKYKRRVHTLKRWAIGFEMFDKMDYFKGL